MAAVFFVGKTSSWRLSSKLPLAVAALGLCASEPGWRLPGYSSSWLPVSPRTASTAPLVRLESGVEAELLFWLFSIINSRYYSTMLSATLEAALLFWYISISSSILSAMAEAALLFSYISISR